jgi:hypothetical protein
LKLPDNGTGSNYLNHYTQALLNSAMQHTSNAKTPSKKLDNACLVFNLLYFIKSQQLTKPQLNLDQFRQCVRVTIDYLARNSDSNSDSNIDWQKQLEAGQSLIFAPMREYLHGIDIAKAYVICRRHKNPIADETADHLYGLLLGREADNTAHPGENEGETLQTKASHEKNTPKAQLQSTRDKENKAALTIAGDNKQSQHHLHRSACANALICLYDDIPDCAYGHYLTLFGKLPGLQNEFNEYISAHPAHYCQALLNVYHIIMELIPTVRVGINGQAIQQEDIQRYDQRTA